MIRILAISGSLRRLSSNTALLHAAARLVPAGVEISVYDGLGNLPLFHPELSGLLRAMIGDFVCAIHPLRANQVL